MARTSEFIEHEGHKVLYENYAGLGGEEMIQALAANDEFSVSVDDSDLLVLIDVTGCLASKEVIQAFKKSARDTREINRKIAVVGVIGLNRFFLETVNRFARIGAKPFDNVDDAKDWLVKED